MRRSGHHASRRRRAVLETLEDRRVLASFLVITPGDAGSGSCTSGACTLRDAVQSANSLAGADTIQFGSAVAGTINLSAASGALLVTDPVAITGPGADMLTIRAATSPANEFRVFDVADTAGDVTLDGLTVTGGRVTSDAGGAIRFQSAGMLSIRNSVVSGNVANNGGGIYSQFDGTVSITSSTISGNTATYGPGGGIHNVEGNTTLASSVVSGNAAYGSGGGVFSPYAGTVTLTDSEISSNRVTEPGYHGGGLYSGEGDVTISGSTISGNTSPGDAGGIYNFGGIVSITATTIHDNQAGYSGAGIFNYSGELSLTDSSIRDNTSLYGDGGGISNDRGGVTLARSTISGNNSVTDGGGLSNTSGRVIVRSSLFTENTSGGDGGAIATITGDVTLANSTVSANAANVRGGGVQSDSAAVRLVNSTFTLNTANIEGGGIGVLATNDGESILIHNSIVAGNTAPMGPDFVAPGNAATNLDVAFSLIGHNGATTLASGSPDPNNNFVGSPSGPIVPPLLPLAENGGPTRTHALVGGSLALDGGSNALALDFGPDAPRAVATIWRWRATNATGCSIDLSIREADPAPRTSAPLSLNRVPY